MFYSVSPYNLLHFTDYEQLHMLNPVFNLLEQYEAMSRLLRNHFNVTLERKTFLKDKTEYYLLKLPLVTEKIEFKNASMIVVEQHLTIPRDVDKKTDSCYHYTITLEDKKTKNQFKVRLFFDALDRITVEPKLFAHPEETAISALDQNDIDHISDYFATSSKVILCLREQQRMTLRVLSQQKRSIEETLENYSKDLSKNIDLYREEIDKQLALIRKMESIGSQCRAERIYYERLKIRLMNESRRGSVQAQIDMMVNEFSLLEVSSQPTMAETSHQHQVVTSFKNPLQETKSKKTGALEQTNIISDGAKLIELFDSTNVSQIQTELVAKMLQLFDLSNQFLNLAQDHHDFEKVYVIRRALESRLNHFFNEENIVQNAELYLKVVHANICAFNSKMVEIIVKDDNVKLLREALSLALLSESTRYELPKIGKFTFIELCIHFGSIQCFKELIKRGFTLNYIDENNSPLHAMLADPLKYDEFISNVGSTGKYRLYERLILLIKIKQKCVEGDELRILEIREQLLIVTTQLLKLLDKKPIYKAVLNSNELRSVTSEYLKSEHYDPKIEQELRKSISLQQAILNKTQALLNLLKVMRPEFKNILSNKEQPSLDDVILLFSYPMGQIIPAVIKQLRVVTDRFNLLAEMIRANKLYSINGSSCWKDKKSQLEYESRMKAIITVAEQDYLNYMIQHEVIKQLELHCQNVGIFLSQPNNTSEAAPAEAHPEVRQVKSKFPPKR